MTREDYIDIPRLFENHIDKAQFYSPREADSYTHTLSTPDSGIDIIRILPWLEELTITTGLTYNPEPTEDERLLFDTYFVEHHLRPFLSNILAKLCAPTEQLVILGETGGGKTTAINYLYRHSPLLDKYRKQHYIILITCNKDYAVISPDKKRRLTLAEFVAVQLSEAMNKLAGDCGCTEYDIYQRISQRALAKGISEAMRRARRGEHDALLEPRIYRHLLEGENYNIRVFEWFADHHSDKIIDIIVDNLDCFERDERNDCISKLLHMFRRKNTKLILPLRYSTWVAYEHTLALSQYSASETRLPLNSPGFKHIVTRRLTKIPSKLRVPTGDYWQSRMKIICQRLRSDEITEIFNGIFGEDSREKLKAVMLVLDSSYVVSTNDYGNSSKILEALMLGECVIPLPKFSKVVNLFYNHESPGYQNALTLIRLLQIVRDNDPLFVKAREYIPLLAAANYDPKTIRNGINYLLRNGLLSIQHRDGMERLPDDLEKNEVRLRLTGVGSYYLSNLLSHPMYIMLAAQSTYIPKRFTRRVKGEFVVDVMRQAIRQERNVSKYLAGIVLKHGHEIFVPLTQFCACLRELEQSEQEISKGELEEYRIAKVISQVVSPSSGVK